MKRKANISLIGAGVFCLGIGLAFLALGTFMYLPFGLAAIFITGWLVDVLYFRKKSEALHQEFLNKDYGRKSFLIPTGSFERQLAKLSARVPALLSPKLVAKLQTAHTVLAVGESQEERVFVDEQKTDERYRVTITKLKSGKTSVAFRAKTDVIAEIEAS